MASNPLSSVSVPQRLTNPNDDFRLKIKQVLYDMRVAIPCIVQSFDPVAQTVTVLPAVKEKINVNTGGVPVATDTGIGLMVDVPVLIPGGGGFYLTFPIQEGDECLVIFADFCYNSWWQNGGSDNSQEIKRRHDLCDGFALFMPRSQPEVIDDYNASDAELRNADGTVVIQLTPTAINITSASGPINITAGPSSGIVVKAENVAFDANVIVEGSLTVFGSTSIDGKTFLTHTHSGVQTGGGDTGPVV